MINENEAWLKLLLRVVKRLGSKTVLIGIAMLVLAATHSGVMAQLSGDLRISAPDYSLEEIKLGRQFMRSARAQLKFVGDPEIIEYVTGLGTRLLQKSGIQTGKFEFLVIKDDQLNAFAVPGGFIGVHTGLIARTESESELASVMAHEIAHITQRHLPRMIETL